MLDETEHSCKNNASCFVCSWITVYAVCEIFLLCFVHDGDLIQSSIAIFRSIILWNCKNIKYVFFDELYRSKVDQTIGFSACQEVIQNF